MAVCCERVGQNQPAVATALTSVPAAVSGTLFRSAPVKRRVKPIESMSGQSVGPGIHAMPSGRPSFVDTVSVDRHSVGRPCMASSSAVVAASTASRSGCSHKG
jgi:hypothetical protein